MKLKRMIALALAAAVLCSMLVFPAGAAAPAAGFTDIADPGVAQAAETLRLLGIVSGDGGGAFTPNGTLTRAQFCKMAVMALGKGAEADAQMNRTIFRDVLGNNWARGFINLAATITVGADSEGAGGDKLMGGKGNSYFYPDDAITFAEAVMTLMRVLGYSSRELTTGASWFDGAIATARAIGLTDGLELDPYAAITRGQTAILFENMLFTNPNKGAAPYLTGAALGGKIVKEAVILSLDAVTDDGSAGAILLTGSDAPYKTDHIPFDPELAGCRAALVLDKNDKVVAIQPSTVGSKKTVSIVSTEATYLTAAGGARLDVDPATVVYKDEKASTYKSVYLNLKPSTQAVFHYNASGKLEYIYLPGTETAQGAVVARDSGGNPFSSLVGSETGYRVVKNGLSASLADIRTYDVGTYDKATKTLYVSDLRITGVYENVAPSPVTPTSVTVLGADFPVLPSAYDDFSRFKIGATVTLLLTADGQVAGAVSPDEAKSTTVGVVKISGEDATVTPLSDIRDVNGDKIVLHGKHNLAAAGAESYQGQLVTVSSSRVGRLNLSRLTASGAAGTLDVNARTLGGAALADNVYLYERVGNGAPSRISFDQLTRSTVPASKITYVGKDYAGRVNIIVLDDVTGDQYVYGMAKKGQDQQGSNPSGTLSYSNPTVYVETGTAQKSESFISANEYKEGTPVGLSGSLNEIGGVKKLSGFVTLKSVEKVSRSAFEITGQPVADQDGGFLPTPIGTVTVSNMVLPIAGNVACYNKTTKKWFASLDEARAYSDSLTVYYDRAPQEGGKVRFVVVE